MNTPDCQCEAILALIRQCLDQLATLEQTPPVVALRRLFQAQYDRRTEQHHEHIHPSASPTTILSRQERLKLRGY